MNNLIYKYIEDFINNLKAEDEIKKAMRYVLISDGKLIRPLVFFSLLKEYNYSPEKYINIAVAIEMIHTYSLIHDDLPAMDDDDYRRGKLTLHKKYDEATAILVGDSLLTHSFEVLIANEYISDAMKVSLINSAVKFSGVNEGMINGQYLDLKNEGIDIDEFLLSQIHIQKTSKLLELPMVCALIVTENSDKELKISQFASKLGLLYQIKDDYLDFYGENLGKEAKSDLKNNKRTYVNFYSKVELEKYINQLILECFEITHELNYSEEINKIVKMFGERTK